MVYLAHAWIVLLLWIAWLVYWILLIAFGSFWRKLTLEERFMRETFDSAYEEYRRRTAALIPFLF